MGVEASVENARLKIVMEKFKDIFSGLDRAHGVTYVDKKGEDGQKIKGKSFVQRNMVTNNMWEDHLNGNRT